MRTIEVKGVPIARKRPKFTSLGKFTKAYDPQKKEMIAASIQVKSVWGAGQIDGPVKLEIAFEMPIPASWSKSEKARRIYDYHIKKPDLDNLVKAVKDYCNGIVWVDDRQVSKLHAYKYYGPEPKTIIKVEAI